MFEGIKVQSTTVPIDDCSLGLDVYVESLVPNKDAKYPLLITINHS